jgi:phosphonatase-like hydrolase
MMRTLQLIVFDMAGTTVEDGGQVPAAFAAALRECGVALRDEELANVRGASKREAIAELVARHAAPAWQGRADEVYASFVRHLENEFGRGVKPIEGAEAAFEFLRGHGVRIALTTGFDRDVAGMLLDVLRWRSRADACLCGDDVVRGRPAPYLVFQAMAATGVDCVHHVGTVGDTTLDLQAGYNAGVKLNIGVLSGAHDRARLAAQPHTHLIASVAQLPALVQSL